MQSLICASLPLLAMAGSAQQDKCRALVLSGGANNGVWESGVLYGLLHYGNPVDFTWDVASGVSAGGINAGMIATWAKGSELDMTEWMSLKYSQISSRDIWTLREGSPYELFFEQPSLLDSDPALQTITKILSERSSIERRFVASTMDVNLGEYTPLTQENTSFEQLPQAMLSSGSIPTVFQPQHMGSHIFMDGGTAWNVNLDSAVQQCLELVQNQEDIIVDVLITRFYTEPEEVVEKNAFKNMMSGREIHKYFTNYNSLMGQSRAYPDINFRYYFMEHRHTCPGSQLNFNNETTWCLQEQGREDAKQMLNIGQGNIHQTLEEWYADQELKKAYPVFRDYLDYIYNLL